MGVMTELGRGGLKADPVEACKLYRMASEVGHPTGQCNLGSMYHYGYGGMPKDIPKAAELYLLSAEQGHRLAQTALGMLYHEMQEHKQAAEWFTAAALSGDTTAQYKLGDIYWKGTQGRRQDLWKAIEWFSKAADQGHEEASRCLELVVNEQAEKEYKQSKAEEGSCCARSMSRRVPAQRFPDAPIDRQNQVAEKTTEQAPLQQGDEAGSRASSGGGSSNGSSPLGSPRSRPDIEKIAAMLDE